MRLAGKTAIIMAAGAGIGRASALAFAREGAKTFAVDIDAESLSSLDSAEEDLHTAQLDVTDRAAHEALRQRIGSADILMYCAGYVHTGTMLDCPEDEWRKSLDVNLTGLFYAVRAWLPGMIARGGGSIVNVASIASSVRALPMRSAYAVTKAGVIGFTKSIAADFAAQNIRCNAICPGAVDSPSFNTRLRESGDEAGARAALVSKLPMGRPARIEEIAALALYLASDEASYTTGAIHIIDGGLTT